MVTKAKKKESLHVAFIQDDNGDVTRGPAEPFEKAFRRAADSMAISHRIVKVWTEEVKS